MLFQRGDRSADRVGPVPGPGHGTQQTAMGIAPSAGDVAADDNPRLLCRRVYVVLVRISHSRRPFTLIVPGRTRVRPGKDGNASLPTLPGGDRTRDRPVRRDCSRGAADSLPPARVSPSGSGPRRRARVAAARAGTAATGTD